MGFAKHLYHDDICAATVTEEEHELEDFTPAPRLIRTEISGPEPPKIDGFQSGDNVVPFKPSEWEPPLGDLPKAA